MCRGSIAPGRRTTFKGKSGIRSSPMNPIADNTRPCLAVACRLLRLVRRNCVPVIFAPAPSRLGVNETPGLAANAILSDLGKQAFHLGAGVLVAFLLCRSNPGG